ncbi:restriction endonuclease subunit S [Enorma phocaeensis]|uniref:restriction endonuclease subunit S n=1 Tax=Enorma phocaeensis TaxID=1871019 RepID=UPI00320801EB
MSERKKLWSGDVPETWKVAPLKHCIAFRSDSLSEGTNPDYWFRYVDIGSVTACSGVTGYAEMAFRDAPSRARKRVRRGDTIVSTVRTYLKAIARIEDDEDVIVSTGFAVLEPCEFDSLYLTFLICSDLVCEEIERRSWGIAYPAISETSMSSIIVPIPPLFEQQLIADHLRRACAKLDSACSVLERQLQTLDDYRKSLIQEAVTKGLNPDVELKPSGIDWIGIIPAGWKTTKLKGLVRHFESGTSVRAAQYPAIDGEPGVLSLSAVFQGRFNADANKAVGDDEAPRLSCPVRYGTLLVSRCNTSEWVGTAALVDKECDNLYLPDKIWQIDCETSLHNRYVRYALSSPYARAYCWMMSVGASESMQNIASFDLLNMPFAIPETIEEMQAVVEYLDDKISKVDALIAGKRKQLETLRAQRQSLIYEYVTGKRRVV